MREFFLKLRRKELEAQRMTKLKEMLEKRRIKQSKIEQTQLEKEKERIETAKAKEKTREIRLAIIEAQFQANKQEVKKRILQKVDSFYLSHLEISNSHVYDTKQSNLDKSEFE